jgi:DNA transformation protein
MFGGAGIFADGTMIGLIIRDTIYLKADETSVADFEREGSKPFSYMRGKGARRKTQAVLSYWQLPERLYDDPEELAGWAERAFAIATKKKTPKASRAAKARPRR